MSVNKQNGFLHFLRVNIYYILVVVALAVMIAIIAITSNQEVQLASTQAVQEEQTEVADVNATPVAPTYVAPLASFSILKEYSDTDLMYNASLNRWEAHKSVDLSATQGEKVLAVADGEVTQVYNNYLEGTVVVIKHADGMQSLYGSLNQNVSVAVGDKVNRGDVIGSVDCSANGEYINECHLHFELYRNGVKVNPVEYVPLTDK